MKIGQLAGVALCCAFLVGAVATAGCVVVKPYQREVLSVGPMSVGGESAENKFRQHWQESREGGAGGYSAAGGGCGCN